MALPLVVIVGRPNVGKSSLLNALARERISIVDARPGITRDRVSAVLEHDERWFEIVDTGGIGIVDDDNLETHVETQINFAIQLASVVLFLVDVQQGLTPLDQLVAEKLRQVDVPVLLVANKVDAEVHTTDAANFHQLGHGEPLPISALHGRGREALLNRIIAMLGDSAAGEAPEQPVMKLAIVGKRNAGKSTLVNALAGEERCIVSEIPGTTRDAVDVRFEREGRAFIAIDTAGVRKRKSMDDLDYYSYRRAVRSIQRADVVMHLIDATVPVSEVDLKLLRAVQDEYKPLVIAVNKWDLVGEQATPLDFANYLTAVMGQVSYAPITFMTAKTGRKVDAAIDVALSLHKQAHTRVGTGKLNSALEAILAQRAPTTKRGAKHVKIYYATQVAVAPPTIALFCNDAGAVSQNYERYIENRLREVLPFREVPMRLLYRARRGDNDPRSGGADARGRSEIRS